MDTATVAPTDTWAGGGVTVIYVPNPPTKTKLPSRMNTPRKTATPQTPNTPKPFCPVVEGWWDSEEHVYMAWMTTPWPLIAFHVNNCRVAEFQIQVFPIDLKGFSANFTTALGKIQDRKFSVSFDNPDGAGSLTVYGEFSTASDCRGFIMFSEGFQIEDVFLSEVVTVPWTAHS